MVGDRFSKPVLSDALFNIKFSSYSVPLPLKTKVCFSCKQYLVDIYNRIKLEDDCEDYKKDLKQMCAIALKKINVLAKEYVKILRNLSAKTNHMFAEQILSDAIFDIKVSSVIIPNSYKQVIYNHCKQPLKEICKEMKYSSLKDSDFKNGLVDMCEAAVRKMEIFENKKEEVLAK